MNNKGIKQRKNLSLLVLLIISTIFYLKPTPISNSDLRILVVYHKKSPLSKEAYYLPIHAGRAIAQIRSKDGIIPKADLDWLMANMIGDDTGDNISILNRYACEMTAIYWAWKNYKLLGNPNYIGLNHYRRLIQIENIDKTIDLYTPHFVELGNSKTILEQYSSGPGHKREDLLLAIKVLKEMYPSYAETADKYLYGNRGYFYNIFIMKKEIFFEYCRWIFPILFKLNHMRDFSTYEDAYAQRALGFISERLTGIFIYHKALHGYKLKEVPVVNFN